MAYAIIENGIVANAVEASAAFAKAQGWIELSGGAGIGWRYEGGKFFAPEQPEQPAQVVVVSPADLWRRATEDEAEQIEQAMAAQPARLRNLFRSASTYQSDDPLWQTLMGAATQLFGADRAAELLAPSA